jgi:hypothetical protein
MGREQKRKEGRRFSDEASTAPASSPLPRAARAARATSHAEPRWFPAIDPQAAPPAPPPRSALGAAPLLVAAPIVLAVGPGVVLRFVLGAALFLGALVLVLRARPRAQTTAPGPRRGLEITGDRLLFRGHGRSALLLSLAAPFGVTLLATPRKDRVVALLSSSSGTYYVGARYDAAARMIAKPILDRTTTVGSDDGGLEAVGPDGEPLLLAPSDLAALLDALATASPGCLDRFILTDAHGEALQLDGRALQLGARHIDLATPLEWRSIVFQEAFGQAVAVYQGTWIRQGSNDLCMVCLLPSLGPAAGPDLDLSTLDRATLRDLRLMQASPEEPPPTEQRVAIDRLFMLPLRSALDRAPRTTKASTRARA